MSDYEIEVEIQIFKFYYYYFFLTYRQFIEVHSNSFNPLVFKKRDFTISSIKRNSKIYLRYHISHIKKMIL